MKIVDRIVSALMSLAVIPVAIFTPLVHWIYQILGYSIINGMLDGALSDVNDTGLTEDNLSLYSLYDLLKSFGFDFKKMFSGDMEMASSLEKILPYLKLTGIFFIIALLIALVTGIICAATNAKKTRMILSGCGIASLIGMMISFNKAVLPLTTGQITPGSLFDMPAISFIIKIETINLSTAWVFMLMLFAGVILWTLSYILTSDKDEPGKKQGKKK